MKRMNVIWNLTRLCPFRCPFCCVSAVYVEGFKQVVPIDNDTPVYPGELSFSQQRNVLDQMGAQDFRIDFSGGDVFINPRNIDLILYASKKFGNDNIGLSIPGTFISDDILGMLRNKISDIEITLDNSHLKVDPFRPDNYAKIAVHAIRKIVNSGIRVGVQTVLRKGNMDDSSLRDLCFLISDLGVKKWSLLKFFPVGRFYRKTGFVPRDSEYRRATKLIVDMCKNNSISPHFQYLMPHYLDRSFKCRAISRSIGINPSGRVSSCFWALDKNGDPLKGFEIGKVPEKNIYEILKSEKALYWRNVVGDCKNFCQLLKKI